jgi:hypothetical protein
MSRRHQEEEKEGAHVRLDSPFPPSRPALPTPSTAILSASPVSIFHLPFCSRTVPPLLFRFPPSAADASPSVAAEGIKEEGPEASFSMTPTVS